MKIYEKLGIGRGRYVTKDEMSRAEAVYGRYREFRESRHDDPITLAEFLLGEWQKWNDGEVYGYRTEESCVPYRRLYPDGHTEDEVDWEDCDVVVDMTPRYQQNQCIRFGQSRFGPLKRGALDGKVWWCMYDYADRKYVTWYRFRTRRQALVQLAMDLRLNRLPYEPDPGFCPGWIKARTAPEVADLVDGREPPWVEASKDR